MTMTKGNLLNQQAIFKLVEVLEKTDLGFTTYLLKEKHECKYCAEGVFLKGIIPDDEIELFGTIGEACDCEKGLRNKLKKTYGVDFVNYYRENIDCVFGAEILYSLSEVITHINDHHSESHKETAERLRKFTSKVDLVRGLYIDQKG